ncbi:MAG: HD domain-containing protein [Pirellulales bacterium]|nr:HD domain-containing protein [Pirellulales bacterium]
MLPLTPRFAESLSYAAQLHASQYRKGTRIPYVSHLLAVTAIVLEYGGDEDQAIAAILHDAVEDQGGANTAAEIGQKYGPEVLSLVLACTDTDQSPKPPWQARKQHYIDHLAQAPERAFLISGADKLHNLRSILRDYLRDGEQIWARFGGGKEGSLWYYRELTRLFVNRLPETLYAELQQTLHDLEEAIRIVETTDFPNPQRQPAQQQNTAQRLPLAQQQAQQQ